MTTGRTRTREECLRAAAHIVLLAAIRIAREDAAAARISPTK